MSSAKVGAIAIVAGALADPPRVVEVRPLDEEHEQMVAGRPARLRCSVPSANPVADVHWEFQTKEMAKPYQLNGENSLNRTSQEFGGYEIEV